MSQFKPGIRCLKCRSHDFTMFNSNLLQCSVCLSIDNLLHLAEDYFQCLEKVAPGAVYSRRDIFLHTGFELNNYAYNKLAGALFSKVSARKYKFGSGAD